MKVKQLKEILNCVNEDAEVHVRIYRDELNVDVTKGDYGIYAPLIGLVTSHDSILRLHAPK